MDKRYPLMCYDQVFKAIFSSLPNLLARLISDITDIQYELLENNIYLETNELPIEKSNEKAKKCDFIVKYDNNSVINIELNNYSHTGLILKNLAYACKLFSTSFEKGKNYNKNFHVVQININTFKEPSKKPLSKYYLKEDTTNDIYNKNIVIYSLNVVNCYNLYYNNHNKRKNRYINWGTLIYSRTIEEIKEVSKNLFTKQERDIFMEKLSELNTKDLFRTEEEMIRLAEWEKQVMLDDAREEGIEQNIQKTIKLMIENNIELEKISKITGKTIDEIKEISKNN